MPLRISNASGRKLPRATGPLQKLSFEQNIGLVFDIRRQMPLFLTLRDAEGSGLVTAIRPPGGRDYLGFEIIIVGKRNSYPYPQHESAIHALGAHLASLSNEGAAFPIASRSAGVGSSVFGGP